MNLRRQIRRKAYCLFRMCTLSCHRANRVTASQHRATKSALWATSLLVGFNNSSPFERCASMVR